MPDALKILLNAQIRHWLLILLGGALVRRFGFAEEVLTYLRETNLDYVTILMGVGAALVGVWTRWRSKLKQKIALELPAGAPEAAIDAELKNQPLSAVLKATPVAVVLLACVFLTSCGVTVRTPYGDMSYDQPAKRGDGKTALR